MGELEHEYAGKVRFTIVPAEETAKSEAAIAEYGFTEQKHGLVVFTPEGEAAVKMPGHNFGKEQIAAGIEEVLAH